MTRLVCSVCDDTATHTKIVVVEVRKPRSTKRARHREARHYCDPHAPHGSVKLIAR